MGGRPLNEPSPRRNPATVPKTMARTEIFTVATTPWARSGMASRMMDQSSVTRRSERGHLVGEIHAEAEPLLLQLAERVVGAQLADLLVEELDDLGVLLAARDAAPVVGTEALDHRVLSGRVAQHHGERRHRVVDGVHLALGQRDVRRRMVVEHLDLGEAVAGARLYLVALLIGQDLAGRAELDADDLLGQIVELRDRSGVASADEQRLRGLAVGNGEGHAL